MTLVAIENVFQSSGKIKANTNLSSLISITDGISLKDLGLLILFLFIGLDRFQ